MNKSRACENIAKNKVYVKIAETRDELESAYTLIHRNYVKTGYMKPYPAGIRVTIFDFEPQSRTFIAVKNDKVIATLTTVFDSRLMLPSNHLFYERLNTLRKDGKRICEISKLACCQENRHTWIQTLKLLFRASWIYASKVKQATDFCIMVEPKHVHFYQKYLLFHPISGVEKDPDANNALSVLMHLNLEDIENKYKDLCTQGKRRLDLYNFFITNITREELSKFKLYAQKNIMNSQLLYYFAMFKTNLLRETDFESLMILFSYYRDFDFSVLMEDENEKQYVNGINIKNGFLIRA